ncbi:MAG: hypothetical protein R3F02_05580 [Thiolinea sp.]
MSTETKNTETPEYVTYEEFKELEKKLYFMRDKIRPYMEMWDIFLSIMTGKKKVSRQESVDKGES